MVGLSRNEVALEAHDSSWRETYREEAQRLRKLVGDRVEAIEHVGSTAVPGIPAKPIIDVLVVVGDGQTDAVAAELGANGYDRRPNDDVPDRVFLARGPPDCRTHYLSLVESDSDCHREQVAFRDYLRDHSAVATAYAALKRELAAEYPENREAYTAEKSAFVEDVLDRALPEYAP
ncbi:UPF0157 family protein [Halobacterium hubeiense]|uniref:UPF0157 family protein n=1 Tax=Halobacterium hubeiense TaxID=1407499 RepID=A0A0U5CXH1_9EURY|nr:GrpB family protein [Halobacterium hubeiense]CQH53857.1 UPF0157 family protein [Halobacterium hubeiense]